MPDPGRIPTEPAIDAPRLDFAGHGTELPSHRSFRSKNPTRARPVPVSQFRRHDASTIPQLRALRIGIALDVLDSLGLWQRHSHVVELAHRLAKAFAAVLGGALLRQCQQVTPGLLCLQFTKAITSEASKRRRHDQ